MASSFLDQSFGPVGWQLACATTRNFSWDEPGISPVQGYRFYLPR